MNKLFVSAVVKKVAETGKVCNIPPLLQNKRGLKTIQSHQSPCGVVIEMLGWDLGSQGSTSTSAKEDAGSSWATQALSARSTSKVCCEENDLLLQVPGGKRDRA